MSAGSFGRFACLFSGLMFALVIVASPRLAIYIPAFTALGDGLNGAGGLVSREPLGLPVSRLRASRRITLELAQLASDFDPRYWPCEACPQKVVEFM